MKLKDWIILALLAAVLGYTYLSKPKVAYVRSQILMQDFEGMREARQNYQVKVQEWQTQIETLSAEYERGVAEQASVEYLTKLGNDLKNQRAHVEQLTKEADDKMSQAVIEQINTGTQAYGEEQGYDIIFGTTESGNILFGKDALDITDELLEALNQAYQPEGKE